ncbi:MAG: AEC family transporter [Clostridia bacterium]|nr:AEC family transporter [Clostridia bacterium]
MAGTLFYKILQLFAVMVCGFAVVKLKVVKSGDSTLLSKLCLYLFMPAAILNAFDMDITPEILSGILVSVLVAVLAHILLLVIDAIYKKCGAGAVERTSVMYPNAGNLVIPIVSFVLGPEWVIYTCAYMSVQQILIWTHGAGMYKKENISIKKIVFNPNIIAIMIGVVMIAFSLRLPAFAKEVVSSLGTMVGNAGMLIAGMLAAKLDFGKALKEKRLYIVMFMRLILCPLLIFGVIKAVAVFVPDMDNVLLISYIACMTPPAATVLQFAQVNETDVDFAVSVNIIATIMCIATMPLLVMLYQMI